MSFTSFSAPITPDWEAFVRCIRREGTPRRVHYIELFLDGEVWQAVGQRFGLFDGLDPADPFFLHKANIAIQRYLGYDYVRCGVEGLEMPMNYHRTDDTADLQRDGGRQYMDEHRGPITTWLMGYETLCYALYDQRDLVRALADKLLVMQEAILCTILQFDRVKVVWGSDDMGFRTGTLISPKDLREFVLPGHKRMAEMAHERGLPYLLHTCGKMEAIMPDLIDDVKIDARHSFEDVIEPVIEAKQRYGDRIALLGGIDLDFLCRADEAAVRRRVRATLDACHAGGGYCLGTGNSVANYIPLDNYLAMQDEGRRY